MATSAVIVGAELKLSRDGPIGEDANLALGREVARRVIGVTLSGLVDDLGATNMVVHTVSE